jgi:5-(carboxyamino)imidazole ribonucleotide mutase
MPDAMVIFGSDSDAYVYSRLMESLKARGVKSEFHICSAHHLPQYLDQLVSLSKDCKVIIAGAGLSAALPGAIAARTLKPVIGLPVKSNYEGVDALLSIHQMPPGMPVLGVGVNAFAEAAGAAAMVCAMPQNVKVWVSGGRTQEIEKRLEACTSALKEFGISFEESSRYAKGDIMINFFELATGHSMLQQECLQINVPVAQESSDMDVMKIEAISAKGLWVGLNRGENAAIAAAEILNLKGGKYAAMLNEKREKKRLALLELDSKENAKYR